MTDKMINVLIKYCPEINNKGLYCDTDTYKPVVMDALRRKLVEKGDWEDFFYYCGQVCNRMFRPFEFTNWLMDPERFCSLVGEWLEENKA
jgi:hypothetical protein